MSDDEPQPERLEEPMSRTTTMDRLYSLNEAEQLLGTYSKLVRQLVERHAIPTRRVGKAMAIDQAGFDRLRVEVARWKARFQPNSRKPARKPRPSSG
jgi:hypothetical protein